MQVAREAFTRTVYSGVRQSGDGRHRLPMFSDPCPRRRSESISESQSAPSSLTPPLIVVEITPSLSAGAHEVDEALSFSGMMICPVDRAGWQEQTRLAGSSLLPELTRITRQLLQQSVVADVARICRFQRPAVAFCPYLWYVSRAEAAGHHCFRTLACLFSQAALRRPTSPRSSDRHSR